MPKVAHIEHVIGLMLDLAMWLCVVSRLDVLVL